MSNRNKEAQARSAKRHYEANKEAVKARAKKYTTEVATVRNRAYIKTYKESHPCLDCGETDIVVLQFHHQGDKDSNVSDSRVLGWSLTRLIVEIEKCIMLCANCHLRRHHKERCLSRQVV